MSKILLIKWASAVLRFETYWSNMLVIMDTLMRCVNNLKEWVRKQASSRTRIAKGSNVLLLKVASTLSGEIFPACVNPWNWKRQSREGIYGWAIWMDLRVPQFGFLESGSMKISFSGAKVHSCKEQMVIVSFMSKIHPDFGDPQIYWSYCNAELTNRGQ